MIRNTRYFFAVLCFVGLHSAISQAQGLYIPRNIKLSLQKGTRSATGLPGKNYWQNRGRYTISVTALPPDRNIRGTEEITYFNNSPDTLSRLHLKLFLNIHKPGASRDGGASPGYLTSGMEVDEFKVNGQKQKYTNGSRQYTEKNVRLPSPLLPHDSTRLSFTWHYPISRESGREGMIDSTSWFLAYFYPRVAVYDDYNGWDDVPFVDSKEFYSDFNDYTVNVKVPANFIVWGTGTLVNAEAVLQPFYAAKLNASFKGDSIFHLASLRELQAHKVTAQHSVNTWTFTASHIPDMTFGLSDHFNWDASSTELDPVSHRRVSVQAAYNDTSADFHHMVGFGKHAVNWLSNNWPGVAYPYEKSTIFQGFAGMEYPMMVNDESYRDTTFSRFVAEHEIAHTYMPFYMGINETRYGFMDEGWATTFEHLIADADLGRQKSDDFYKQFRVEGWAGDPSADQDIPIITPGSSLTGEGLGNNEYGKPSLGYLAVKDMLGDVLFKKTLHIYMADWNGKHPSPWDFFNTFSRASGQNLNWFWSNWFFSPDYIDLGVQSVTPGATGTLVKISNIGGMYTPFDLVAEFTDGSSEKIHKTSTVWKINGQVATIQLSGRKKLRSLLIDGGIFMDANPADNTWNSRN